MPAAKRGWMVAATQAGPGEGLKWGGRRGGGEGGLFVHPGNQLSSPGDDISVSSQDLRQRLKAAPLSLRRAQATPHPRGC